MRRLTATLTALSLLCPVLASAQSRICLAPLASGEGSLRGLVALDGAGRALIALDDAGVVGSADGGRSWRRLVPLEPSGEARIAAGAGRLVVLSDERLLISDDAGESFQEHPLPLAEATGPIAVTADRGLLVAHRGGLARISISEEGVRLTENRVGLGGVSALASGGGRALAVVGGDLLVSDDDGRAWRRIDGASGVAETSRALALSEEGVGWVVTDRGALSLAASGPPRSIVTSPRFARPTALAVRSGALLLVDGGGLWRDVDCPEASLVGARSPLRRRRRRRTPVRGLLPLVSFEAHLSSERCALFIGLRWSIEPAGAELRAWRDFERDEAERDLLLSEQGSSLEELSRPPSGAGLGAEALRRAITARQAEAMEEILTAQPGLTAPWGPR